MADFLTRLAGRTLGVVPTVQPMMASIYAPGSVLPASQTGLPLFDEDVSTSASGRERMNLPLRAPLQASMDGQESEASIFASPMPFSSRQETLLPQLDTQAGTAQPVLPALSGDSQTTLSSLFVSGEEGQQGVAHNMPLSPSSVPLSVSEPANPLHMREVQTLPLEAAQRQMGNASLMAQEQQEDSVPHTVIQMNSVERQRVVGNLRQAVVSEASYSRASMRRAAADAGANRHELSREESAPSAPATPTIQVTIGRIEVRAAQPPPAQRQVARAEPRVMSLEEYLHQQAKGGQ